MPRRSRGIQSGLRDVGGDAHMDAVDVALDALAYGLAKASRQTPDDLTLTFEDRAVALLREHTVEV